MPREGFRKTHCFRGHPLSGDNLRLQARGKYTVHKCRACERLVERRRPDRMRTKDKDNVIEAYSYVHEIV